VKKIIAIGEALIDMSPSETGCKIKEVNNFSPHVGGAPTNVCGAIAKLGGEGMIITQLGNDPFGDKILDYLIHYKVNITAIQRTDLANTSLAFVSLEKDGKREFSFYRKPSADLLMEPETLKKEWFDGAYALHFCSVDLVDFPMRKTHLRAIEMAKKVGAIISFDPNLRFALWDNQEEYQQTIREFLAYADIVKIADDELEFITGEREVKNGWKWLQLNYPNLKILIYTKGERGASVFGQYDLQIDVSSQAVVALDTTGAGDGFIGVFLYQMAEEEINYRQLSKISKEQLQKIAQFANDFATESVQHYGAISSYPSCKFQ